MKQLLHRKQIRNPSKKRTSVCTLQGSLSIEAALALPLFVFAMVCVLYLFEIMATQTVIKSALHSARLPRRSVLWTFLWRNGWNKR